MKTIRTLAFMALVTLGVAPTGFASQTGTPTANENGFNVQQANPPAAVVTTFIVAAKDAADLVPAAGTFAAPPADTPLFVFAPGGNDVNGAAVVVGKAEVADNTPVAGFNATPQTTAGIQMTNQPGSTATTFTAKAPGDHARALDTGTAENGILGATPADGNHQLEWSPKAPSRSKKILTARSFR